MTCYSPQVKRLDLPQCGHWFNLSIVIMTSSCEFSASYLYILVSEFTDQLLPMFLGAYLIIKVNQNCERPHTLSGTSITIYHVSRYVFFVIYSVSIWERDHTGRDSECNKISLFGTQINQYYGNRVFGF